MLCLTGEDLVVECKKHKRLLHFDLERVEGEVNRIQIETCPVCVREVSKLFEKGRVIDLTCKQP
jgi:hypothetical protein